MSLQAIARAAFAQIKASVPASVIPYIENGVTAYGVRGSANSAASGNSYGETTSDVCVIYVDASEIETPRAGDTRNIDGADCFVLATRLDPAGAIVRIDYSEQKPVSGI